MGIPWDPGDTHDDAGLCGCLLVCRWIGLFRHCAEYQHRWSMRRRVDVEASRQSCRRCVAPQRLSYRNCAPRPMACPRITSIACSGDIRLPIAPAKAQSESSRGFQTRRGSTGRQPQAVDACFLPGSGPRFPSWAPVITVDGNGPGMAEISSACKAAWRRVRPPRGCGSLIPTQHQRVKQRAHLPCLDRGTWDQSLKNPIDASSHAQVDLDAMAQRSLASCMALELHGDPRRVA